MRHHRTRSIIVLVVLALGGAACGPSSSSSAKASAPEGAIASPALPRAAASGADALGVAAGNSTPANQAEVIGATVSPATADIVENARLDVLLRSPAALRSAYAAIDTLAGAEGGFVSDSTLTNARVPSASMTLRVPNRVVRAVTDRIGSLGRVTSQTMSGQDVTGQVVDLSVEITNLTSEESAVRHLLANAGSVHDILTVQQQLFSLQDEIQQLTAQSNSLSDRIQYATVNVALSTVVAALNPARHHTTTLARFVHLAGSHTVSLVRGVFLAIGWSAPGLVMLVVVLGGGLVVWRRRRSLPTAMVSGPEGTSSS